MYYITYADYFNQELKQELISEGHQRVADLQSEMDTTVRAEDKSPAELIIDFEQLSTKVNRHLGQLETKLATHQGVYACCVCCVLAFLLKQLVVM